MKTIILTLTFPFLFLFAVKSQNTLSFGYDASGNRISRTIPGFKSTADEALDDKLPQEFKDRLGNKDIMIYPNPVKNELTVTIPALDEGMFAKLSLYSQDGRLIYQNDKATSNNVFNLSEQPQGIYLLNIQIGDDEVQWKIIKE